MSITRRTEEAVLFNFMSLSKKSIFLAKIIQHVRSLYLGKFPVLSILLLISFTSCSSFKTYVFQCDRQDIALYVNDEHIGNGHGEYNIQKGEKILQVSCRENGVEVYTRNYPIGYLNGNYIEINIPKDMFYGSGGPKISRPRN